MRLIKSVAKTPESHPLEKFFLSLHKYEEHRRNVHAIDTGVCINVFDRKFQLKDQRII